MRWGALFAAALFGWGGIASAATIAGKEVNCRVAPDPTSRVMTTFSRGAEVEVRSRVKDWTLVAPEQSYTCWVSSSLLIDGSAIGYQVGRNAAARGRAAGRSTSARLTRSSPRYSFSQPARAPRVHRQTTRSARRAPLYDYGGGSCPCSGHHVCIGPRGGRYCITSGGNKRYGV